MNALKHLNLEQKFQRIVDLCDKNGKEYKRLGDQLEQYRQENHFPEVPQDVWSRYPNELTSRDQISLQMLEDWISKHPQAKLLEMEMKDIEDTMNLLYDYQKQLQLHESTTPNPYTLQPHDKSKHFKSLPKEIQDPIFMDVLKQRANEFLKQTETRENLCQNGYLDPGRSPLLRMLSTIHPEEYNDTIRMMLEYVDAFDELLQNKAFKEANSHWRSVFREIDDWLTPSLESFHEYKNVFAFKTSWEIANAQKNGDYKQGWHINYGQVRQLINEYKYNPPHKRDKDVMKLIETLQEYDKNFCVVKFAVMKNDELDQVKIDFWKFMKRQYIDTFKLIYGSSPLDDEGNKKVAEQKITEIWNQNVDDLPQRMSDENLKFRGRPLPLYRTRKRI